MPLLFEKNKYHSCLKANATVIVNNVTNINKTNNHLPPHPIEHKNTTALDVRNPGPSLKHARKCCGGKPFIVIQTLTISTIGFLRTIRI
jgi:hypothetical protein